MIVGRRYAQRSFSTSRGPYSLVMSVTPSSFRSASIRFQTALRHAGNGERGQAGLGILGRQHFDRAEPLGQRLRRSPSVCRDAQTPEQLMQPRPLLR